MLLMIEHHQGCCLARTSHDRMVDRIHIGADTYGAEPGRFIDDDSGVRVYCPT